MSTNGSPPDDADDVAGDGIVDPADLPPRAPQPWYVHWAADSLVAFLVLVPFFLRNLGLGLFLGLVIGAVAMPFTQRIEARNLADRQRRRSGNSGDSGDRGDGGDGHGGATG